MICLFERQRDIQHVEGFATAEAGLEQNLVPGTQSRSLMWVATTQTLEPFPAGPVSRKLESEVEIWLDTIKDVGNQPLCQMPAP